MSSFVISDETFSPSAHVATSHLSKVIAGDGTPMYDVQLDKKDGEKYKLYPVDKEDGTQELERAIGCLSWYRPLRPLFYFLC